MRRICCVSIYFFCDLCNLPLLIHFPSVAFLADGHAAFDTGCREGVILAIGRIVGETAALLFTAGTIAKVAGLMDSGRTLAVHMYALSSEGLYMNQAYATAVVLLVLVVVINTLSGMIAKRITKA